MDDTQDTELTAVAKDFLDDAVKDMNSHLYEFNKYNQTVDLVAGTKDYILVDSTVDTPDGSPIEPYKESYAYLVDAADDERLMLTYLPWIRFAERLSSRFYSSSGIPELYSFRNVDHDGVVTLWPTPNDTKYDLVIEFYRRIPLYSAISTNSPNIPEEVETPLFYNALKRLAIHLYGPGHKDVEGFDALESKALTELKAVDKRHPDQQQRFVVSDFRNRNRSAGRRSLYIKV